MPKRWFNLRMAPWLIFAAALAVRLVYFAVVDQPPVQFDARRYVAVGLALPLAMAHPSHFADEENTARVDFALLYQDLIADEDVSWFPYTAPAYPQAVNDVYFTGPVYPSALGAVFRLAPRYDFWVVRILQALLDSLTAALVWGMMRRLAGVAGAWIAGGLWVFYGPAIYKTGELVTETLAIFLGVLVLYTLIRAYDSRRYGWLAVAGVSLGLLVLTKASTAALPLPLLFAWIWACRRRGRLALWGAVTIAATAGMVVAPWVLAVFLRFGVFAVREPTYASGSFRLANTLWSEGYNLDRVGDDFWTYEVWREMRTRPMEYAKLYARKFYRMWSRASDDYRRGYPFGLTPVQWLHRAVVMLAFVGLFFWPKRAGPVAWLAMAFIGYFVVLHLVMHAVSRYNLLAMPMVGGAAAVGLLGLVDPRRPGVLGRGIKLIAVPAVVLGGLWIVRPETWMIWKAIPAPLAAVLYWLAGVALIGGGVWLWLRAAAPISGRARGMGPALAAVFIALFLAQAVPVEGYSEWDVRLNHPATRARRVVDFPDRLVLDSTWRVFVYMDVVAEPGTNCNLRFEMDHLGILIPIDSLVDSTTFYEKEAYRPFLDAYGYRRCDVRSWARLRIPIAVFDSMLIDRSATLTLSGEPVGPDPGAVYLYGGFPVGDSRVWHLPGFDYAAVERLYEGRDPRIWESIPLNFERSRSMLLKGEDVFSDDLSGQWGRQTGEYRLIIGILTADDRWMFF